MGRRESREGVLGLGNTGVGSRGEVSLSPEGDTGMFSGMEMDTVTASRSASWL